MKIRNGFVSNSSSSNFMIVGLDEEYKQENEEFKAILKAEELPPVDEDGNEDEEFYSSYGKFEVDSKIGFSYYGHEDGIAYMGWDAVELFKQDKRLSQIKREIIRKVREVYRIKIPEEKLELLFGQVSSG